MSEMAPHWLALVATALAIPALSVPQTQQPNQAGVKAQAVPTPPPTAPPQGLVAPWDVKRMLANLNSEIEKLKPLLDRMHPQQWIDNGAPPTYVSQYQDTQDRVRDAVRASQALAARTDSLSLAIDAYFRMEALENVARSLEQGIRKYGEPRMADELAALISRDFTNRQKLREYLTDLSVEREQEFKIADEEAQRCRGIISREPVPSTSGTRRRHTQ
jgi:hypothetical protein